MPWVGLRVQPRGEGDFGAERRSAVAWQSALGQNACGGEREGHRADFGIHVLSGVRHSRVAGLRKSVRPLRYRWSARNVILSIITVVGIPAIFFVGMVPVDTHIEMLAEDGGD